LSARENESIESAPVNLSKPGSGLDPDFFQEDLMQMTKAVNYLRWQVDLFKRYVSGNLLEIGGGIGNFTPALSRQSESVVSIEPDPFCFKKLQEATSSLENVTIHNVKAEQLDDHIPSNYQADTVVCLNVLEHIEDDLAAVRLFQRRLHVGGTMILMVPAVEWLYGDIDKSVGHYRRYSRRGLRSLVLKAGLQIETLKYFNLVGLLGWLWNVKVAVKKKQSDSQILIFDRFIVPWLSVVEKFVPPLIGQSLLIVCKKVNP